MKILALEFSSPVRSVAVAVDGTIRGQAEECGERYTRPFALIDEAIRASAVSREEIECIAVGIGPGSYAGIRIAIAIAQGWQLTRGIKLLAINSIEAVAAQVAELGETKSFVIGVDAQREELFLTRYEKTASGLRVVTPFHCAEETDRARIAAGETCYRPDVVKTSEPRMVVLPPSAAALARLAIGRVDFIAGHKLQPVYLRLAEFVKSPP